MANYSTSVPSALALVIALAGATSVEAQQQDRDEHTGIQEIVVTAQKRTESVQDVPISISAFGGDALSERAVGNVSQLASLAPNVNLDSGVSFTASTAVLAASIRGIGASDSPSISTRRSVSMSTGSIWPGRSARTRICWMCSASRYSKGRRVRYSDATP